MLVCILFGYMIDFNLSLIDFINPTNYMSQWILLIISCLVLAFGLVIEVKSDITMLPGDGSVVAIGEVGTIFSAITVGFIIQFYNKTFGYKIDNYLEK